MRQEIKQLLWIVLGFAPLYVSAQEGRRVTLQECIALAREKNPSMEIARARIAGANAKAEEASSLMLPQVKLTGRAATLSSVPEFKLPFTLPGIGQPVLFESITENYSLKLSLTQPVFTGFRLQKNKAMAEMTAQAAGEELKRDQADLLLQIANIYWNLVRAREIETVLTQSVGQINAHLTDVRNVSRQGMATEAEVMKVQVQLSDVKVKLIEAKNAVKVFTMTMNSLISQPLENPLIPAESAAAADRDWLANRQLSDLISLAHRQRPELKALGIRKSIGEASVDASRGGWYPQVSLAANYDYAKPNSRILPPKREWDGAWDIGLMVQWTVWDWFATEHQTNQAKAQLRQTEEGFRQTEDLIGIDVAQAYYSAQAAHEKVGVALEGVSQAEESFRITKEKFRTGLISSTELLDAEMALLQAKLTHIQSVIDQVLAATRLKKATGDLQ
ncbi:MAG: TolC family protein [bacterium]